MHKYAFRVTSLETPDRYNLLTTRDIYGDQYPDHPALYNTYIEARLMLDTFQREHSLPAGEIDIVCMEVFE